MKKSMLNRGFTLIELLVVIAIIGILAAVVIGSLNDARSSGQDASIKQSMANVRQQAELVYNSNGYSYDDGTTGVCNSTRVTDLIQASISVVNGNTTVAGDSGASANSESAASGRVAACHDNDTQYAVSAPLTGGTDFWCVDSTGTSRQTTTALGASEMVCPTS